MKLILSFLLLFLIILFSGCSSKSINQNKSIKIEKQINSIDEEDDFLDEFEEEMEIEKKSDPLSGYNRAMTNFNDGLYEYFLSPVARGYKFIVHKEIRSSIWKFFHNILYPIRLVNNLLQGKIKNSGEETGRFIINSTIGVFGMFDLAKEYFDLNPHNEDFGQTLGTWGISSGYHIVLPFLGASNMRDMVSIYPNSIFNLISYQNDALAITTYKELNNGSLHLGEYEDLKQDAVELYPFLKDIYEQNRQKLIEE
jgi:phospholipid-binding lipoprotein MlaA